MLGGDTSQCNVALFSRAVVKHINRRVLQLSRWDADNYFGLCLIRI